MQITGTHIASDVSREGSTCRSAIRIHNIRKSPPSLGLDAAPLKQRPRHGQSALGIASFLIGLLAGISGLSLLVVASAFEASGRPSAESNVAMVAGLSMIFIVMLTSFAAGLAVGGLAQTEKSRTFAVLGLIINSMLIFGLFVLVMIGMTLANAAGHF